MGGRIKPPAVANSIDAPIRVVAVVPEPTPYRAPLFDLIAERPDIDLSVVYAADAIAGNRWEISIDHPHVILRGVRVPGAHRILRHDYPITPGVFALLRGSRSEAGRTRLKKYGRSSVGGE